MRRAVRAGLALWLGRWLALELASWLGRRRPRGPAPVDAPVEPGRMPRRREPDRGMSRKPPSG